MARRGAYLDEPTTDGLQFWMRRGKLVSGDMMLPATRVGMDTGRAVRDDAERHAVGLV
jgi:hypothetical protein